MVFNCGSSAAADSESKYSCRAPFGCGGEENKEDIKSLLDDESVTIVDATDQTKNDEVPAAACGCVALEQVNEDAAVEDAAVEDAGMEDAAVEDAAEMDCAGAGIEEPADTPSVAIEEDGDNIEVISVPSDSAEEKKKEAVSGYQEVEMETIYVEAEDEAEDDLAITGAPSVVSEASFTSTVSRSVARSVARCKKLMAKLTGHADDNSVKTNKSTKSAKSAKSTKSSKSARSTKSSKSSKSTKPTESKPEAEDVESTIQILGSDVSDGKSLGSELKSLGSTAAMTETAATLDVTREEREGPMLVLSKSVSFKVPEAPPAETSSKSGHIQPALSMQSSASTVGGNHLRELMTYRQMVAKEMMAAELASDTWESKGSQVLETKASDVVVKSGSIEEAKIQPQAEMALPSVAVAE